MNKVPPQFVDTTPQQAPVFTTHLTSYDKLLEGQHVTLEAQVEPRADPNLRIEWFRNGVSLTTGKDCIYHVIAYCREWYNSIWVTPCIWANFQYCVSPGARIRSTFDFGLVTLSINGLRDDDNAIYTCKAVNKLGEAVSTCTLKVEDKHWLQNQTFHPDAMSRIEALEQPLAPRPDAPEPTFEGPVFITHLNNVELSEGQNARFECQVEPSKDPTLKIGK